MKHVLLSYSFLGVGSILCSLDSLSFVFSINSSLSDGSVDLGVFKIFGEGSNTDSPFDWWKWKNSTFSILWGIESGGRIVDFTLLGFTFNSWEKNEVGLVSCQSLDICFFHLVGSVSSVINGDSDSSGESWGKSSGSNFFKREASSKSNLGGISSSTGFYCWSKQIEWCWGSSCSSLGSFVGSDSLVSVNVEVTFDLSVHPMLSQMRALKDIIVFYHVAY
jgi:hypothetical protein